MNWDKHKQDLLEGKSVEFRPKGNSMSPRIKSGQLVKVEPITDYSQVKSGDVVFCRVKGQYFVHLVQSVKKSLGGYRFQIGNIRNHTNGTIGENNVYGKVTSVGE